MATTVNDTDG
jgi:hypothetical protein